MPDNSQFASFRGTYKPLPVDVFNETGKILQDRYFKNRDSADALFQSLNNLNVHDENKGIVTSAIADVQSQINSINGEFERADNVIRNSVKRISNDDLLKQAVLEKSNYDAMLSDLQKRATDPKSGITDESIKAFGILSKYGRQDRTKGLYKDENGIIQNKFGVALPPPKPDVDADLMKIWSEIASNPDKQTQMTMQTQLAQNMYKAGYLTIDEVSTVNPDKLKIATRLYLQNQPNVKAYYDYINTANVLSRYGDNPIPPEDFAKAFGFNYDNTTHVASNPYLKDASGEIVLDPKTKKPIEINTDIDDIFNNLIKDKNGNVNLGEFKNKSQFAYKELLTALDLEDYNKLGSLFAHTTISSKFELDQLAKENRDEIRQKSQITNILTNPTQIVKTEDFDIKFQTANLTKSKDELDNLDNQFKSMTDKRRNNPSSVDALQYEMLKNKLNSAKIKYNNDEFIFYNIVRAGIEDATIKDFINSKYNEIKENIKRTIPVGDDINKYMPTLDEVTDYFKNTNALPKLKDTDSGTQSEALFNYYSNNIPSVTSAPVSGSSIYPIASTKYTKENVYAAINDLKDQFYDKVQEKVKTEGLKGIYGKAITFVEQDKDGNYVKSSVNDIVAQQILDNPTAYNVTQLGGKESKNKLDEQMQYLGINTTDWDSSVEIIESSHGMAGAYSLTFTPKTKKTKGKKPENIIVTVDPEQEQTNSLNVANMVLQKSKSQDANNFVINQTGYAYYGDKLRELERIEYQTGTIPKNYKVEGVTIRTTDGLKPNSNITISDGNDGYIYAYPINNGITDYAKPYAMGKNVKQLINSLATQTFFTK